MVFLCSDSIRVRRALYGAQGKKYVISHYSIIAGMLERKSGGRKELSSSERKSSSSSSGAWGEDTH